MKKIILNIAAVMVASAIVSSCSQAKSKIEDHNENFLLEERLETANQKLEVNMTVLKDCGCFPDNELNDWKAKFKSLNNIDKVDEFESNIEVFHDSIREKSIRQK